MVVPRTQVIRLPNSDSSISIFITSFNECFITTISIQFMYKGDCDVIIKNDKRDTVFIGAPILYVSIF
jgi:hypothetical protein